jgi:hypothetical protein
MELGDLVQEPNVHLRNFINPEDMRITRAVERQDDAHEPAWKRRRRA